jgi:hypothetical protein
MTHETSDEVKQERARCIAILQAARFGDIDGDLRSLISRIESGDPFPDPNDEAEA